MPILWIQVGMLVWLGLALALSGLYAWTLRRKPIHEGSISAEVHIWIEHLRWIMGVAVILGLTGYALAGIFGWLGGRISALSVAVVMNAPLLLALGCLVAIERLRRFGSIL